MRFRIMLQYGIEGKCLNYPCNFFKVKASIKLYSQALCIIYH